MGAKGVTQFARSLIGSHYLWGSAGATPGGKDGAWYRPGAVNLERSSLDPAKPSVFAATCDWAGHFVCAGIYRKIPGGRGDVNPQDRDLKDYLSLLGNLKRENLWYPFYSRFTPRVVRGSNVDSDGRIVWGEDCREVRHFDCVGFVNFVLSQTTIPNWAYDIPQYGMGAGGTTPVAAGEAAADGDILVRGNQHIGLLCADGKVIQAEDHATGVHADEAYKPKSWTGRFRIPERLYWY
jgi:cell wall-associated NlpC family hydrolase